jgi:hypothetical protein
MTAVGTDHDRGRHQPGTDAVRGVWTRIWIRHRGIPKGCARKGVRYLSHGTFPTWRGIASHVAANCHWRPSPPPKAQDHP